MTLKCGFLMSLSKMESALPSQRNAWRGRATAQGQQTPDSIAVNVQRPDLPQIGNRYREPLADIAVSPALALYTAAIAR
jgi:hypothetical protein